MQPQATDPAALRAGRRAAAGLLLTLVLLGAAPIFAASTGSASLFMPQGSGAGTGNGDFITANGGGGLNTLYRYFIEVPAGLTRFRVQLFDADVGAGGAAEAAANRDRARGTFNTSVTYTLIRPDGSTATTLTCTNAVSATCPDNAWVSLLDSATAVNLANGHWELRVDESSAVTAGDDINALGIRADDGDETAGGTELPIYYDSHTQYGVNPPASGTTDRSYTYYPYVTSGCTASENDFDYDSDAGNTGAIAFTSRSGAFSQSLASTALSTNNTWIRNTLSGWTSDTNSQDDGIWTAAIRITSYVNGNGQNGNYANIYLANSSAAANPPTANPTTNAFRVYFPTDGGAAPVKPYLEQQLRFTGSGGANGPNPPVVGSDSVFTVTVRVVNPTAKAITFSAANLVTANVPGPAVNVKYDGIAQVSQGTVTAQPAVGGTGNVTWNPGTLAAGATAILAYRVIVHPTAAGQRIVVTGTAASGNGTRAQWRDETGNNTQARALFLFGPLCELAATQGMVTPAVVSSFRATAAGNAVDVEWWTASEAGTAGFYLYRRDAATGRWVLAHEGLLSALVDAPQGGVYRFRDEGAAPRSPQTYLLVEVGSTGDRRAHGPFTVRADEQSPADPVGGERAPFTRAPRLGARRTSTPAPVRAERVARASATANVQTGARIAVRQDGLYFLGSPELAALFGQPQAKIEELIAKGSLSLTLRGQPVAWLPDAAGKKTANGLYFYGQAIDSLYSAENAYRLVFGKGLLMTPEPVTTAGAAAASFANAAHLEQNAFPATVLPLDPESDYWFWDFVQAGDPTFGSKTFAFDAVGLATPGAASLTVNLQGATAAGVAGEHHATVTLNGTALGETHFTGITAASATFAVDPALLQPAGNHVAVGGALDPGVPYSIFYVDSFDLSYPRAFRAQGDALAFRAATGAVSVGGFSSPAVRILDLADALHPRLVTGAATGSDGAGGTAVTFVPAAPATPYLAAGPGGILHPASLRPWQDEGLRSPANQANLVILTTAALAPSAERLASYRAAQGLLARVVDVETVMDEWNGGINDPHAIAAFLAYARNNWLTAPRYVVLAGAGSLDYRNLLGNGDSLVPPLMVAEADGLFPSDAGLANFAGTGVPGMAIGRIPALTAGELDAYVDKVMAYEADSGAGWAGRTLLVSDAPDQGATFSTANDRIAGLLRTGTTAQLIDLGATGLAGARAALLQGLADGAALVDYIGHGGLDRFAAGGLLDNADVPGLANGPRLPVVTAMTCVINRFAVPGIRSLGELLVDQPGGGAAAVWAPTGLSLAGEAPLLAERFYRLTADPAADGLRLGDLLLKALAQFQTLGGSRPMLEIYTLMGDPALKLKRAPAPVVNPRPGTGE